MKSKGYDMGDPLLQSAADEIQRLRDENERLKSELHEYEISYPDATIKCLNSENKRLKEAIEKLIKWLENLEDEGYYFVEIYKVTAKLRKALKGSE